MKHLIWLLALLSAPLAASMYDFRHQDLRTGQIQTLAGYRGHDTLLLFFEPQCRWCARQAKVLQQLKQQCPNLKQVAMGINGNLPALRQALFSLGISSRGFKPDPAMLVQLGGIPATPVMLVMNAQGQLVSGFRGFVPLAKLKPQLCAT